MIILKGIQQQNNSTGSTSRTGIVGLAPMGTDPQGGVMTELQPESPDSHSLALEVQGEFDLPGVTTSQDPEASDDDATLSQDDDATLSQDDEAFDDTTKEEEKPKSDQMKLLMYAGAAVAVFAIIALIIMIKRRMFSASQREGADLTIEQITRNCDMMEMGQEPQQQPDSTAASQRTPDEVDSTGTAQMIPDGVDSAAAPTSDEVDAGPLVRRRDYTIQHSTQPTQAMLRSDDQSLGKIIDFLRRGSVKVEDLNRHWDKLMEATNRKQRRETVDQSDDNEFIHVDRDNVSTYLYNRLKEEYPHAAPLWDDGVEVAFYGDGTVADRNNIALPILPVTIKVEDATQSKFILAGPRASGWVYTKFASATGRTRSKTAHLTGVIFVTRSGHLTTSFHDDAGNWWKFPKDARRASEPKVALAAIYTFTRERLTRESPVPDDFARNLFIGGWCHEASERLQDERRERNPPTGQPMFPDEVDSI